MYCPKHPNEKMIQLFSSYACDICDGKKEVKKSVIDWQSWIFSTFDTYSISHKYAYYKLVPMPFDGNSIWTSDICLLLNTKTKSVSAYKNRFGIANCDVCYTPFIDVFDELLNISKPLAWAGVAWKDRGALIPTVFLKLEKIQ